MAPTIAGRNAFAALARARKSSSSRAAAASRGNGTRGDESSASRKRGRPPTGQEAPEQPSDREEEGAASTSNKEGTLLFCPTRRNALVAGERAVLALRVGESLPFLGSVAVAPLLGDFFAFGYVLSSTPHRDAPGLAFEEVHSFPECGVHSITAITATPGRTPRTPCVAAESDAADKEGQAFHHLLQDLCTRNPKLLRGGYAFLAVRPAPCPVPVAVRHAPPFRRLFALDAGRPEWRRGRNQPSATTSGKRGEEQGEEEEDEDLTLLQLRESGGLHVLGERELAQVRPLSIPLSWHKAISAPPADDQPASPDVMCVVGPKNSGKSTLCKLLLNTLLSRGPRGGSTVAYLETDVGQPECTPGGILSLCLVQRPLLGPAFCHHAVPPPAQVEGESTTPLPPKDGVLLDRAYYYGAGSPKNDTEGYLAYIFLLLQRYREAWGHVPLVINTHGWVGGMGLELVNAILSMSQPTRVIQLLSGRTGVPLELGWESVHVTSMRRDPLVPGESALAAAEAVAGSAPTPLDTEGSHSRTSGGSSTSRAQPLPPSQVSAHDTRYLHSVTYFCDRTAEQPTLSLPDPYAVHWSDVCIQLVGGEVPLDQVLVALNGSIVGLGVEVGGVEYVRTAAAPATCNKVQGGRDDEDDGDGGEMVPGSYAMTLRLLPAQAVPVNRASCTCIGLGLVRAIDPSTGTLYLTTPVAPEHLERVQVLLKHCAGTDGMVPLPVLLNVRGEDAVAGGGCLRGGARPYISTFSLDGEGSGERNKKRTAHLLRRKLVRS